MVEVLLIFHDFSPVSTTNIVPQPPLSTDKKATSIVLGSIYSYFGDLGSLLQEMFQLIQAKGLKVGWSRPEEYIEVLFEKLIPPTYDHFFSILHDLRRGKKTEIDAMNGAIVRWVRNLVWTCQ